MLARSNPYGIMKGNDGKNRFDVLAREENQHAGNAKFTLGTAVLAGGKSSRMGQNKVLMEYQNRRFLDRICEELRGFDEKPCISAAIPGEYEDLGLPVVCDEHREIGPMEGIRQVLIHTSCDYVFVCAGDMPFITGDLVRYMAEFISSDYDCYCMVDEDHIHPLCAIYSKKYCR